MSWGTRREELRLCPALLEFQLMGDRALSFSPGVQVLPGRLQPKCSEGIHDLHSSAVIPAYLRAR